MECQCDVDLDRESLIDLLFKDNPTEIEKYCHCNILAQSDKEMIHKTANLRLQTQTPVPKFSRNSCPYEQNLARVLSRNEQEFWHAFLANADVFASIYENSDQIPKENDDIGRGWADICFSTAEAVFDLMTLSSEYERFLYKNGEKNEEEWYDFKTFFKNTSIVIKFDLDGEFEGHSFIVYPLNEDRVLVAQSVGGIMRANIRLLPIETFLDFLLYNPQELYGYSIDGNYIFNLSYTIGIRKDIKADILFDLVRDIPDYTRNLLKNAFAEYEDWESIKDEPVDSYFNMNDKKSQWPFYYVDPSTYAWKCTEKAIDVPRSDVSIALQCSYK